MLRFFQSILILCLLLSASPASAQPPEEAGNDIFEEVEQLNLGLENFESIALSHLSTPEKALSYFVRQCREGRFDRAAYALNLNLIDPEQRAEVAPDLAHKLYLVMDRKTGFPFDKVPDRLDGQLPLTQSNTNSLGGRPRKSILLDSLSLQVGEFEIYLTRYRKAEKTSAWLFSPSTVSGIEEAYELMGPRPWEKRVPNWFKHSLLLSTPLWAWLLLGIAVLLSTLLAKAIIHLCGRFVHFRLLKRLQKGLIFLAACWGPYVALQFWVPLPGAVRYSLLFLGFCAFIWLFSATMHYYSMTVIRSEIDSVEDLDETEHRDEKQTLTYLSVGRRLLSFLLFTVGVGVVAAKIPHFETVGVGLLASAGVLSVLIGVAAQPLLGNVISGVQIGVSRPIRVGDSISYEGTWCYVEDITFMYVLCRTWDEMRLVIPLRHFTSHPFKSDSLNDPRTMRTIEMKLDYSTRIDELREEYHRLVAESQDWDSEHEPKMEVVSFNEDTVTIRATAWSRNASSAWELHCDLREQLLSYLQKNQTGALPRRRLQLPRGTEGALQDGQADSRRDEQGLPG